MFSPILNEIAGMKIPELDCSMDLSSSRWQKIVALFEGASALPEPNRNDWLDEACAGDVQLEKRCCRC